MHSRLFTITCSLFLSFHSTVVQSSDIEKEKRWYEQVADSVMDGENTFLNADDHKFWGIYTEAEEESSKGMIVVHGTGIHPNWDQIIQPVRVEMTMHGWNTLSIQMPILANDADYEDYIPLFPEVTPRLKAAEAFLIDKGMKEIVVVSHSQGATMTSYYLIQNPETKIQAAALIGMSARMSQNGIDTLKTLRITKIPILDLYGDKDLPAVMKSAGDRKKAASKNINYIQKMVKGANHFFDGKNTELLDSLNHWLATIK